ncbi:MAG: AAA family ATPase, partial [Clostridiaceae bacterium]
VNQYRNQIKKGDRAYIWVSGSDGGIVASGTILTDPKMHSTNLDDPYSRGESLKSGPYLAVDIQIDRKFTQSVVSRSVLLADERTKKLEILTYPGQTNFQVTTDQEAVIESIIAGSYQREPALATTETEVVASRQYWLYAPGEQARFWDEFYDKGIIGLGSDELGSLSKFSSNAEIKAAMKNEYGEDRSYINDGLALWEFANTIQVDDVIIVKKGNSKVLGRGIVVSDYIFDGTRQEYKHIRKVKWTDKGVWEHPGQAVQKALTNITIYNEYVSQLEALFPIERGDGDLEYTDYSEMDFLDEVYIDPERYSTLKGLLLRKKNIILQGAPGVGKTFAAQRLAFSIMGKKDTSRVKVIQFHQSYSYEDFVMGYRPDGSAFRLAEGPFYKFCKAAEKDGERPYFFIIDEINRGNLSKIFGELLMLIENDKRGEQNSLRLLYKDEQFFVPPNVHIIGMMNTADRSLAMIDYALRRRFAFFDIEPAFSSDGFKTRQASIQNRKYDKLISTIESLNTAIAEDSSLGAGFRIGHSYFCTTDVVDDSWLSSVIEYELIPLLLEYWFDEPSKVESWSNQLRKF